MNNQNLKPFQPGNKFGKGRIKGSKNRKTILTLIFKFWDKIDEQERKRKNAIRRKKRRAKRKLLLKEQGIKDGKKQPQNSR